MPRSSITTRFFSIRALYALRSVALAIVLIAGTALSGFAVTTLDQPLPGSERRADNDPLPRWLGPDGNVLPFASEEALLDFLRSADVVSTKQLADGINKPLKVRLRQDGIELNVIFRTVQVKRAVRSRSAGHDRFFRDSYRFEVAAYELSRLLGIDNVPPAVIRKLAGREGSLQLWVEQAQSESGRLRKGETPPDAAYWARQRQLLPIFDNLIYNFDRNHGNLLLDAAGKMWFVDHTRSFKRLPALATPNKVRLCDRRLWHKLRNLDGDEVHRRLRPYVEPVEIQAMLKRRDQLVKLIDGLIAEFGADAVLFDV